MGSQCPVVCGEMFQTCWYIIFFTLIYQAFGGTEIIQNGGFEAGTDNWENQGCQTSAEDWDVFSGGLALHVSRRSAEWSGPLQRLNLGLIGNQAGGRLSYAIKLHTGDTFEYSWTLRINTDNGDNYVHLIDDLIRSNDEWKQVETLVDFPQFYDANYVELYLEGAPTNVEPLLDNVSLIVG